MKVAVAVFPGTNCDHDIEHVYGTLCGATVHPVWHRSTELGKPDLVVIPGGFSYGDYLRTGALAKISPIMSAIKTYAREGGPVLGICNGFQILCESGLLPGVLLMNRRMKFISRFVSMRVEQCDTPFTKGVAPGSVITCPMAHFEGNYFADQQTLESLEQGEQVVFRYCDAGGEVRHEDFLSNRNGAAHSIAGICNRERNVVGLMPHPERAAESVVGAHAGPSGWQLFHV